MKGILFDLDGTLLDTLEDLKDAVNHALAQEGYPLRSLEQVRRFVGNGVGVLMARAVPEGVDPAPALAGFKAYYTAHCREKTRPYPGIGEALESLGEKYPLAIVSNKLDGAVKALGREFFPGIYALGEQAGCPRKPEPEMLYRAMAAIGVESCVYVGDSEVDVVTAKNAGVPCLSVLWGFRDREDMEKLGQKHFCQRPEDLEKTLEEMLDGE